MKTLRAFWHWVDNDKPARITREHLSPVAAVALCMAEAQVASRAFGDGSSWSTMPIWDLCSSSDGTDPNARPEFFRPELVAAVRELSLAICPALEAMHAAVPESKPQMVKGMDFGKEPGRSETRFKREYLGKWAEAKDWLPANAPPETFFGVDRARDDDRPLSGVRVPMSFTVRARREPTKVECPCLSCATARAQARDQVHSLGIEAQQYLVATHDGLVPFEPGPEPSAQQRDEFQRMRTEVQQRNEYDQRALALQAVDATHPRVRAYNALSGLW